MKNVKIYIGLVSQNNKKLSKNYVLAQLSKLYANFTVIDATGYYLGNQEPCLVIEVYNGDFRILDMLKLAYTLNQEAIGVYDCALNRFYYCYSADYAPDKTIGE